MSFCVAAATESDDADDTFGAARVTAFFLPILSDLLLAQEALTASGMSEEGASSTVDSRHIRKGVIEWTAGYSPTKLFGAGGSQ